jgi:transcriptional regulator with XRE-family HTH domain
MEFRILGLLEVAAHRRLLTPGAPRQRALLAMLLLRANRVVSADQPYLSDIERGNVNPTLQTLTTLADALDLALADLVDGQPGATGPPLSVSLQRFVRSNDFARRIQRLARVAERPVEDVRREVIDFLANAPKRASGELTPEDWRRLLTYYASLLEEG